MSIGDKLKKAVLVPAATPIKSGKFLEAANKEENHLDQIISDRYQGKSATYENALPSPAMKK
jgi:hypothetical protein